MKRDGEEIKGGDGGGKGGGREGGGEEMAESRSRILPQGAISMSRGSHFSRCLYFHLHGYLTKCIQLRVRPTSTTDWTELWKSSKTCHKSARGGHVLTSLQRPPSWVLQVPQALVHMPVCILCAFSQLPTHAEAISEEATGTHPSPSKAHAVVSPQPTVTPGL